MSITTFLITTVIHNQTQHRQLTSYHLEPNSKPPQHRQGCKKHEDAMIIHSNKQVTPNTTWAHTSQAKP